MTSKTLLADSVAVISLIAACGSQRAAPQPPIGFQELTGRLEYCRISGGNVSVAVRTESGLRQFEMRQEDIPWPSQAYRDVITTPYQVAGDCPGNGTQIGLMTCNRCPPTMIAAEVATETQALDETHRRLWIFQQFEDRLRPGDAGYWHLLGVSLMLARHNKLEGRNRAFWVRDRLAQALDTYSSTERAAMMIERFGRPEFSAAAPRLVEIYKKHHDEVGLVKAVPYLTSPFVGSWGHFVTEVYVEGKDGRLTRMF